MDSLTHIVLGAALGTAVLGRKVGPRAAVWGAICSSLPDLDVLVPQGDPVRDFTFHRGASHGLFWLTLAAPFIAWAIARLHRSAGASGREWLALVWLALISHPLLDAFTVYGTQLLLPFSDYPVGLGSMFIIDPLYSAPLIVGVLAAMRWRLVAPARAARWNTAGLVASTAYLAWTLAAQWHVEGEVQHALAASPLADGRMLVTAAPFNSLLWRVVVMDDAGYYEGYRSILDDGESPVNLVHHSSESQLLEPLLEQDDWAVQRLAWFAKGFYGVREVAPYMVVASGSASTLGQLLGLVRTATAAAGPGSRTPHRSVVMEDLRMGHTPWFAFSFVVGEREGNRIVPVTSRQVPMESPPVAALGWEWRRIFSEEAGPPPTS
jgi:inner membrane protein